MWLDMLTGSTDSVKFGSGYIYVNQFQFGFRDGLGQFKFGLILDESSSGQFRVKLIRICLGMGQVTWIWVCFNYEFRSIMSRV